MRRLLVRSRKPSALICRVSAHVAARFIRCPVQSLPEVKIGDSSFSQDNARSSPFSPLSEHNRHICEFHVKILGHYQSVGWASQSVQRSPTQFQPGSPPKPRRNVTRPGTSHVDLTNRIIAAASPIACPRIHHVWIICDMPRWVGYHVNRTNSPSATLPPLAPLMP